MYSWIILIHSQKYFFKEKCASFNIFSSFKTSSVFINKAYSFGKLIRYMNEWNSLTFQHIFWKLNVCLWIRLSADKFYPFSNASLKKYPREWIRLIQISAKSFSNVHVYSWIRLINLLNKTSPHEPWIRLICLQKDYFEMGLSWIRHICISPTFVCVHE